MLTRQHSWVRCLATFVLLAAIMLSTAEVAFAQEEHRSSIFTDILRDVALDPTTYAPAIIGYDATMRDWNTSQPFFQSGYVEHNARFTVSGLPNDRAIGYEAAYAGTSFATPDKLGTLQYGSPVMNVTADRTVEFGLASAGFDDEGVAAQSWDLVRDGIFVGYQLDRTFAPRLGEKKYVPGPPKRFAQAMGAAMSTVALVLAFSTAMPPISSSAARFSTAQEPQKNVAFQKSLPGWIRP